MRQAEDIVWSTITESGKGRFDYSGFKDSLGELGDDRTAEYILFQIIVGLAEKLSATDFLSKIRSDLLLFGYSMPDEELEAFLADKAVILSAEIHAAEEALFGFAQGKDASAVLAQVRRLVRH